MTKAGQALSLGIELIDEPGWMGGTLYLRNLVLCLARLPAAERPDLRLLGAPGIVSRFHEEFPDLPIGDVHVAGGLLGTVLRRLGWASRPRGGNVDVVYPGFGPPVPGAVTIRWIPDFQHRYLPALFSSDEIAARDQAIGAIAARGGVVVLSSEVAAADFERLFPGHRTTPRVWVDSSAWDTSRRLPDDLGIPESFLYLPNQFWAHKNHITVLRALALLRRERGLVIDLVCTGAQSDRRNAAHFDSISTFIREQGMGGQVHLLGLLPRDQQLEVLRCAAAVVQPSLFEGWSTVVEDARAVGRPIFLSDIPVHREQAPPRAWYFAPTSAEQLASLLEENWLTLRPGPDRDAERAAKAVLDQRVLESARTFCSIAREALRAARGEAGAVSE